MCADKLMEWIKDIGPRRVGAICTDNAANMKKARQIVVDTPEFHHIQQYPCMMHGFSLLIGSLLGHPWAADRVSSCQPIVSYFRSSTQCYALLLAEARLLNIQSSLVSSNITRFTSVHQCLESVVKLEKAFSNFLTKHPSMIRNPEVRPVALKFVELLELLI